MNKLCNWFSNSWPAFVMWLGAVITLFVSVFFALKDEIRRQVDITKSNNKAAKVDPSFSGSAKSNIKDMNSFGFLFDALTICVFRNSLQPQLVLTIMLIATKYNSNQYLIVFLALFAVIVIGVMFIYEHSKDYRELSWDTQKWFRSTIVIFWILLLFFTVWSLRSTGQTQARISEAELHISEVLDTFLVK